MLNENRFLGTFRGHNTRTRAGLDYIKYTNLGLELLSEIIVSLKGNSFYLQKQICVLVDTNTRHL